MKLISEFKTFIVKGNAVDMAVGIIIGAAFGSVVKSLVDNIMMPPLGYLIGGLDFASWKYQLAPALEVGDIHPLTQVAVDKKVPAVVISYGLFVNALITLLIQGFAIFLVVKGMNSLKKKEEKAKPKTAPEVVLLGEIRDLLKSQSDQDQADPEQSSPEQTSPDKTGPDKTGPDKTGPDKTGSDQQKPPTG